MASLNEIAAANPEAALNVTQALATMARSIKATNDSLDAFFLSSMGLLVYFMQAGFAFLEAGSTRTKGTSNILIKNVLDAFLGGLAYYAFGWALAYGEPSANGFCGTSNWFLINLPDGRLSEWFYEYVFAASSATIVSGALAERCNFVAYLIYSVFITGFVYPVVSHWVWSPDGWLFNGFNLTVAASNGTSMNLTAAFHDFAGSGAVHATGGMGALVGAALLGSRLNRFHPETGQPQPMPGHSVPHVTLGAFILYFTFLAFNGGSQMHISQEGDGEILSIVMVNTVLSSCSGAAIGLLIGRLTTPYWSLIETINGSLAGTVAICSGCNVVYPWGAIAIGGLGAVFYAVLSRIVLRFKIDDPASSVAVHYGGGVCGVLAVAFFRRDRGVLMKWDRQSGLDLLIQVIGLLAITAWTAALSLLVFGGLRLFNLLRASQEFEIKGVDLMKHGEPAYPEAITGYTDEHSVQRHTRFDQPGLIRRPDSRRRVSSGMLYTEQEEPGCVNPAIEEPLAYA